MYDYILRGKNNYAVDRALARKLVTKFPGIDDLVRDGRSWLLRAAGYVADPDRGGVRQFLDLGAGLPTSPSVFQTARGFRSDARIMCVDNDPVVVDTVQAMYEDGAPDRAIKLYDIRSTGAVLEDPDLNRLIDFTEPVCVIMSLVLHFLPAGEATRVVRAYIRPLAPGSYLIMSAGYTSDGFDELQTGYTASPIYNHDDATWARWLDGLELVPPGLADVRSWPGARQAGARPGRYGFRGVVARVPAGSEPPRP